MTGPTTSPLLKAALSPLAKRGPYDGARLPRTELTHEAVPDPARLRAYARVCGFEDDGFLPAPYPHVLAFPLAMRLMTARDFPFPVLGLVHTRIELTRHVPLASADRLTLAVRAEGTVPHARGTEFGVHTRALLDGEEVWHSRSTYLFRHKRAEQGARESRQAREAREERAALPLRATWELPAGLGRRYAAASGDRNPIHLHPLTARLFGFPRALAHGMWTFARCLAEAPADLRTAEAAFRAPVLLPARVTYGEEDGNFEVRGGVTRSRLHVSGKWGGRVSTARPS
ncbi:MaoC family dehydratase [Streptomyces sp. NPDC048172]|uniref:MaoC family dehydratase n=1 Tax=Streptomyces sp. NPDC048172 TaxID=3365505 RepID=UPI003722DE65